MHIIFPKYYINVNETLLFYKTQVKIKPLAEHIANEIKTDTELITKIKHIYVFRDLLCLSKSTDNSIGIRRSRQGYLYPVSLIDTNIKIEKLCNLEKSTYLPESVFNRWFVNTSPSTILKHMCKLYNRDKVSSLIFKFKSRIDTVVRNVGNQDYMDWVRQRNH